MEFFDTLNKIKNDPDLDNPELFDFVIQNIHLAHAGRLGPQRTTNLKLDLLNNLSEKAWRKSYLKSNLAYIFFLQLSRELNAEERLTLFRKSDIDFFPHSQEKFSMMYFLLQRNVDQFGRAILDNNQMYELIQKADINQLFSDNKWNLSTLITYGYDTNKIKFDKKQLTEILRRTDFSLSMETVPHNISSPAHMLAFHNSKFVEPFTMLECEEFFLKDAKDNREILGRIAQFVMPNMCHSRKDKDHYSLQHNVDFFMTYRVLEYMEEYADKMIYYKEKANEFKIFLEQYTIHQNLSALKKSTIKPL